VVAATPWLLAALAVAAAAGPSLLAFNVSPSPTFLNQALALLLWGGFVAAVALLAPSPRPLRGALREAWLPLAALAALMAAVLWSWGPGALPAGLALSALGLLLACVVLLLGGAAARASPRAAELFALFCAGWVVAGVLSAAIGAVQVFAPQWPDGQWLARSGLAGRAVGNLRQPNHLSSLLLWAAIALVPLLELGRLKRGMGAALFALMCFAVVLTASRTGVVGIGLLALWGVLGRRLARPTRALLLAAPLFYLLGWLALSAWAEASHHAFGGETRLAEADLSGSRFAIWANALALIRAQPWAGVGFGEFNLAWTLTPFPGRPVAFFDHTHNLPLQLLVELGLPLGGAVLALLLAALWRAWRLAARDADAGLAVTRRSAWMMLLLIGLHSLLEYPLWYAYFVLPTAWLFGYALGRPVPALAPGPVSRAGSVAGSRPPLLFIGGVLVALGSALAVLDYARVARVFAPPHDGSALEQRIADGERSVLFAHHAAYAAATTHDAIAASDAAFKLAPHYLLDTRLMIAWAEALARAGELDKARALAQRLREFRNPQAAQFFEACDAPPAGEPLPFQCEAPRTQPGWRDYLR
jgi:O-antigen ligase